MRGQRERSFRGAKAGNCCTVTDLRRSQRGERVPAFRHSAAICLILVWAVCLLTSVASVGVTVMREHPYVFSYTRRNTDFRLNAHVNFIFFLPLGLSPLRKRTFGRVATGKLDQSVTRDECRRSGSILETLRKPSALAQTVLT